MSVDNPAAPAAPVGPGEPSKDQSASLWSDARRELLRNPIFVISSVYILIMMSFAFVPKLWTRVDPQDCQLNYGSGEPMFTPGHWLGTSQRGCDYWSHTVYGANPSLQIALYATVGIVAIGLPLGVLAGFYGGWVDALISRLIDIVFALPFLLGALVILGMLRKYSIWTITLVLVVLGWTTVARIMRGSVIAAKNLDYVQAAKALGAKNSRLMFRHILPNAIAPVFVIATIALGGFVAAEATLTFLGVGLQEPAVSWGLMISRHDDFIETWPHLTLIPVTVLVGTVLSFILIGDALRDALDPKLR
ncbi:ABC transporter permease [Allorhizocola rhizosphaerae]|uniref:ABC transporter permease n=1 Tax=Allorhizocola rhizosphaerae TaxID=1872709 RepID=UPI001FE9D713|nr:ABC transporter permease [Allorhizocola rhizosphaerae]